MNAATTESQPAVLAAADLSPGQFLELVGQLCWPDEDAGHVRILAEAPGGWTLDFFPQDPAATLHWYTAAQPVGTIGLQDLLQRADNGRIFAPSGELKWRVLPAPAGNSHRVVFLGERDWTAGALPARPEREVIRFREPREVLLWGQRSRTTPEEWVELRIPHRFRYPVAAPASPPGPPRGVKAIVEVWMDDAGRQHFVRLVDLKEMP